jgi:hypothetical protein
MLSELGFARVGLNAWADWYQVAISVGAPGVS